MAEIPEIADRNEMDEQTAARLDELENLLRDSEKLRRRQLLIAGGTVLLMLLTLTVFVFGLVDYFRTYPKKQLMHEVIRQNRLFLGNPYIYGVNPESDRRLVRYFLAEMRRETKTRRPLLRQSLRSGVHSLHDFSETELREFFRNRLYIRLTANAEEYLAGRKLKPDRQKLRLLRELNAALAAEITGRLFGRSAHLRQENYRLFLQETEELRHSPVYGELKQEPLESVEERMLENFLECLVCRLNENKAFGRKE